MFNVFFYEAFQEEEEAIKRHLSSNIQAGFTWKTIQECEGNFPPASLVSMRTQSIIPPSWENQLAGILTRSTGYDHIHRYWQQCRKEVPCGHLPLYCHRAVAEQALLLWMSLLRKLPQQTKNFKSFHRNGLTGEECQDQTLLVVGVGHIGYEVVKIGKALGMNVLGVDRVKRHSEVTYCSIEEGLLQAKIVVCAMNLTQENFGYFNYQRFKCARQELIFVNIARGELSPSSDLLRLLKEGRLGGIALDVYDKESLLATSLRTGYSVDNQEVLATLELAQYPNVIFTPHNAFNTQEAVERKALHSVQQIEHFLNHRHFIWSVPQAV